MSAKVTKEISDWLEKLGMSEYARRFAENDIDASVLHHLTDQSLKELGVSLGHRLKILAAIKELSGPTPEAVAPAEPKPRDTAERRHVTVMFCDLVGSTALSARMDPEDLREVISAYQKCVAETVQRFGGFVAKDMGDGVLVYFGYPQAHEHDAERAVRAGLELIRAVGDLKSGTALQTRVGIATGLVAVGDLIGSGAAQEQAVVGETPNIAARLQSIADPNAVVIAESTRRLLGNLFDLQDLGAHDLKGIGDHVKAWAILRPAAAKAARAEEERVVELLYTTNRRASFDESYYSGERSDRVTYGAASVRVPESHRIGKVELPFKLKLFSFTLYEEPLNPENHFVINSVDVRIVEDWKQLVSSSGQKSALVFVHGFNNTFRDALYRAAQIMWDLQYSGVPVLFSWPSRGAVLDYIYDRDSALGARDAFIETLRNLRSAGVDRIDILAHSMGNLVMLDSLAGHLHTTDPLGIVEILMAAPDLDRDHYKSIAAKVRAAVRGMTLYASSKDRALAASKRIAGNIARAGDVPEGGPILIDGIDAIDVTAIGAELFGLGHGPFASTRSILNDIALVIATGTRPPNRRLAEIRGMPLEAHLPKWWRYTD